MPRLAGILLRLSPCHCCGGCGSMDGGKTPCGVCGGSGHCGH